MPTYLKASPETVSHYYVLNVEHDATSAQIKRAFRCLSRRYHTDKNPGVGAEEAAELNTKFVKLLEAYKCLLDEASRKIYDTRCATIVFSPRVLDDNDPGNWFREQYEREKKARAEEAERRRKEERAKNATKSREQQAKQRRETGEGAENVKQEEEEEDAAEFIRRFVSDLFAQHQRKSSRKPDHIPSHPRAKAESPNTGNTPQSAEAPPEFTPEPECPHKDEPEYCANCYARLFDPVPTWSSGSRWSDAEYESLKALRQKHPCGPFAWDIITSKLNDQYGRHRSVSAVKSKYYK
ncbi:hypothetical protein Dda_2283 [Drechslerella dactyloides]|uniref:J domain-containing protein n=1 Tax=Drechslerella dactyloides TaxID=74499 RepID=A0AAD6J384_DREDA|nr:hypothetical protein Dda_2283 [Drechslerella dactyloides]